MKKMNEMKLAVLIGSLMAAAGCGDASQTSPTQTTKASAEEHGHAHGPDGDHGHAHGPNGEHTSTAAKQPGTPHGGTPVQLGDHGYHLELVPDHVDSKMLAYVLDGHMDKQVNVSGSGFELVAKVANGEQRLNFTPVTNAPNATSEKTSVFSASSPMVKNLTNFEGMIPKITLDGKSFENVTFSYPKGTRHEH